MHTEPHSVEQTEDQSSRRSSSKAKSRRRWRPLVGLGCGLFGLVALAGVAYAADYFMSAGQVPRGVTVGGVDIGGMSETQAEQRLRNKLENEVRQPVQISAGNLSSYLDPAPSGLQVDWKATIDKAGRQPLNPITRIKSFTETREVGIVSSVNDANLNEALRRVAAELTRDPEDATLAVAPNGTADIKDDIPGQSVNEGEMRVTVQHNWLNTDRRVDVPVTIIHASRRREAADNIVKDVLDRATKNPVVFHGRDDVKGVLDASNINRYLKFEPEGDHFKAIWDQEAARQVLQEQLGSTEIEFRNASFKYSGSPSLEVVPSQDGSQIKWDTTLGEVSAKMLDMEHRDHEVTYEDKKATYTTEMASKATFDQVMGEFTTGGFSSASGTNIRLTANMVNGAVVLPGETFSLNGYTGPRGAAQGFVESGVIQNGRPANQVGGGISQFATTLYNAAYFAGMEDVEHRAHSYYISRYPAGREATVYENSIDLKFKNTFDTPVFISATTGSDSVTVRLLGVKHVDVESVPGPRTNHTEPQRMVVRDSNCVSSSGIPGFKVTDTRIIKDLNGKVLKQETKGTTYDAQPIVVCERPTPPAAATSAPAEDSSATPVDSADDGPNSP